MNRPRLLRACARLALAVFCVHAGLPLAAGARAGHTPPAGLAVCTAAGLKLVAAPRDSAPAPRQAAADQHCVFCLVPADAALPAATGTPPLAAASAQLSPWATTSTPGRDVPRPEARGPPDGRH
jgi:hypothetical protein